MTDNIEELTRRVEQLEAKVVVMAGLQKAACRVLQRVADPPLLEPELPEWVTDTRPGAINRPPADCWPRSWINPVWAGGLTAIATLIVVSVILLVKHS